MRVFQQQEVPEDMPTVPHYVLDVHDAVHKHTVENVILLAHAAASRSEAKRLAGARAEWNLTGKGFWTPRLSCPRPTA